MEFFVWLESLPPSEWLRYSLSFFAFPLVIAMHTVGLAWIVGPNLMIDLRILGFAPKMSLTALGKFLPVMIAGFWINLITGAWLSVAYATTTLTNPMIYIKLVFIALAIVTLRIQLKQVIGQPDADTTALPPNAKLFAGASIFFWVMAILTGRLMAYHDLVFGYLLG